jgi:hypothetical protein
MSSGRSSRTNTRPGGKRFAPISPSNFRLEFVNDRVESAFFEGRTAVDESQPLAGGTPFLFKGRSMVVHVRDR